MKTLLLFIAVMLSLAAQNMPNGSKVNLGTQDSSGATVTRPMRVAASDPATCTVGDMYINTASTPKVRLCTTTNTWSDVGSASITAGSKISVNGSTVAWNPFDVSRLVGYDDFCGVNAQDRGGTNQQFSSKMPYVANTSVIFTNLQPCGLLHTTNATAGNTSVFSFEGNAEFALLAASQAFTIEVVFQTSDATNASYSAGFGADGGIIHGGPAGMAIQALAGVTDIVLSANTGFTATLIHSGVAYTSNTTYKATMSTNGTGQACIQVNAGAQVCGSSGIPTTVSNSFSMYFGLKAANNIAVTGQTLYWAYNIPGY